MWVKQCNHPPVITISIGGMVTIPSDGWFILVLPPLKTNTRMVFGPTLDPHPISGLQVPILFARSVHTLQPLLKVERRAPFLTLANWAISQSYDNHKTVLEYD